MISISGCAAWSSYISSLSIPSRGPCRGGGGKWVGRGQVFACARCVKPRVRRYEFGCCNSRLCHLGSSSPPLLSRREHSLLFTLYLFLEPRLTRPSPDRCRRASNLRAGHSALCTAIQGSHELSSVQNLLRAQHTNSVPRLSLDSTMASKRKNPIVVPEDDDPVEPDEELLFMNLGPRF